MTRKYTAKIILELPDKKHLTPNEVYQLGKQLLAKFDKQPGFCLLCALYGKTGELSRYTGHYNGGYNSCVPGVLLPPRDYVWYICQSCGRTYQEGEVDEEAFRKMHQS